MASPFVEIAIDTPTGEHVVKVTNPDRDYFPGLPGGARPQDRPRRVLPGGRRRDRAGAPRAADGAQAPPGGRESPPVYTKRVPKGAPPWVQTATVEFPSGRSATELCPVDVAHVAWAVQMSTFDFHPWPSRRDDVEHPDELRIDLDPMPGTGWADVVETALEVKALYDELGLRQLPEDQRQQGHPRLPAGEAGVHVPAAAPRGARRRPRGRAPPPELATSRWWKEERGERVFLDYNRMARDQTIASAYSVRARPRRTVSAPLTWDEVPDVSIEDFDIWTMRERFAELGDVHAAIDDVHHDLAPLLELYEAPRRGRRALPAAVPEDGGRAAALAPVGRGPGGREAGRGRRTPPGRLPTPTATAPRPAPDDRGRRRPRCWRSTGRARGADRARRRRPRRPASSP